MGKVHAVCISTIRGVAKQAVPEGNFIVNWGIEGDAHAEHWHRQVSLLAEESIDFMRNKGLELEPGAFAENITTEGLDLAHLPIGTRLGNGEVVLEVTQIGKKCHHGCAIFKQVGDCIMPREGIFAKVLTPGILRRGDRLDLLP